MTKDIDLVQCISDHEVVMFANNYYFPHPSSLSFFIWPSVTEVLLLVVTAVLYRERVVHQRLYMPDVLVGSGRSKIVEIASGLSIFHQDIPIVGAITYASWKESSLKCLLYKKLCLDDREFLLAESTAPYGGHRLGI